MHRGLIFAVLHYTVEVFVLHFFETSANKELGDLLLGEIIRSSLIHTSVKVIANFIAVFHCEPQLGQVEPSIVAEIKDCSRR